MELITADRLKALAERRSPATASLFLPTHRAGPDTRQDPIRFKNLLAEAACAFDSRGLHDGQADDTLERLQPLEDDRDFWQSQGDGLALLADPGWDEVLRLPISVPRRVTVGDHVDLTPLVPMVTDNAGFHILALSQKRVRLLAATRFTCHEVEVPGMPRSLEQAVGYQREQRSVQAHTSTPSGRGPRAAEFHGQGGGQDDDDGELASFLHQVDAGVRSALPTAETPLVIAAVDELAGHFRRLSHYPDLLAAVVPGNPDEADEAALRDAAWPLVAERVHDARRRTAQRARELVGTGRAVEQIAEVVTAAADGRVETLFADADARVAGSFDPASRTVTVRGSYGPQEDDLVARAVLETVRHDGAVHVGPGAEVPSDRTPMVALLRY